MSYQTSTAAALDAADGVIDGKYFGAPIVESTTYGPTTAPITSVSVGTPSRTVIGPSVVGPAYQSSTAAALDAADGVMDGAYFGRPIIESPNVSQPTLATRYTTVSRSASPIRSYSIPGPTTTTYTADYYPTSGPTTYSTAPTTYSTGYPTTTYYSGARSTSPVIRSVSPVSSVTRITYPGTTTTYPTYQTSAAAALDAADGVMDGKYFGAPIVNPYPATYTTSTTYPAYQTSAAAALDAADGVIDGKFFGAPIVETTPGYRSARSYSGAYTTSIPAPGAPSASFIRSQSTAAAALDAADGVMDGKFYGHPIVDRAGYHYDEYPPHDRYPVRRGYDDYQEDYRSSRPRRLSMAEALDAADGVMDGAYYGRPIVEAPPQMRYSEPHTPRARSRSQYEDRSPPRFVPDPRYPMHRDPRGYDPRDAPHYRREMDYPEEDPYYNPVIPNRNMGYYSNANRPPMGYGMGPRETMPPRDPRVTPNRDYRTDRYATGRWGRSAMDRLDRHDGRYPRQSYTSGYNTPTRGNSRGRY